MTTSRREESDMSIIQTLPYTLTSSDSWGRTANVYLHKNFHKNGRHSGSLFWSIILSPTCVIYYLAEVSVKAMDDGDQYSCD